MGYKIAIASGKGGTGKTTVSVNLFHFFNQLRGDKVALVDCDVEEPNDAIFFDAAKIVSTVTVCQWIPELDEEKCTFCGKCVAYCEFNALVVIPPPVSYAEVNAHLCHSCGACNVACDQGAVSEKQVPIGRVARYHINKKMALFEGRLSIGSAMQTMLIKELKKKVDDTFDIVLYDAPPGTGCPVVETINNTDYVLLIAEPTPFGLHDLALMVDLIRELNKPYGVIINKAGLGDNSIYHYLSDQEIEILGELPFSEKYAAMYSDGNVFDGIPDYISGFYKNVIEKIEQKAMAWKK